MTLDHQYYGDARSKGMIQTGDLAAFTGTILNPSNALIMAGQLYEGGGNNDHLHKIIHVGLFYHNRDTNEMMLGEFTFTGFFQVGFRFTQASKRVKQYHAPRLGKRVIWSPLRNDIRGYVSLKAAQDWLDEVRVGEYTYDLFQLPWAVSKVLAQYIRVAARPASTFCSPGAILGWQHMGALPHTRRVLGPRNTLAEEELEPSTVSPAEICRMKHIHQWDNWPVVINGRRQLCAAVLEPS
jgi:hypothetical protein